MQLMKHKDSISVHMLVWNTFLNDARVYNEAHTLKQAGYAVTVHALAYSGMPQAVEYLENGVCVRRYGKVKSLPQPVTVAGKLAALKVVWRRLSMLCLMALAVIKSRPAVVHAHDVNILPAGWLAARLCGAALVYDAHEISTHREGYRAIRNWVAWLEKKIMPRADGCITTTNARAKFFARAYGIKRPLVLQNRPRYCPVPKSNRIRDELGLDKPWPIVLYQGGLQPGRGLPLLVQAAVMIPNAYFVLIGGGALASSLRELSFSLGLSERVYFINTVPLDQLPQYTASADIGIQPIENTCLNHFTTDSNKLFEYVMGGLPVVASELPEIRSVVNEFDIGLLFEPGNLSAMQQMLQCLIKDDNRRLYFARSSRIARSDLNWDAQESAFLNFYMQVVRPA